MIPKSPADIATSTPGCPWRAAAAGTTVQVICFVNTSGKYWLKIESPAGYVAARNIDFPRSNGSKVPAGVLAC